MSKREAELRSAIETFLSMHGAALPDELVVAGVDALPILAQYLRNDSRLEVVENLELVYKAVLRNYANVDLSGQTIRTLATFQKEIGPFLKYKNYTIKATLPLGYSIFLHEPGQGFSFQRHIQHKIEAFRIIDVMPGGYVFFCDHQDWQKVYDHDSFSDWLRGAIDPGYEPFRYYPNVGDVFVMDSLNIVHTVIGCLVEEFATVSTDMVDRLHDQNRGKTVPSHFTRANALSRLNALTPPSETRLVLFKNSRWGSTPIVAEPIVGGTRAIMAATTFVASEYRIGQRALTNVMRMDGAWANLYVWAGQGSLELGDSGESKSGELPAMRVNKGDALLIPQGACYRFSNDGEDSLVVSEHRIASEVALI